MDFFVCILFEDDGGLSGEESCGCFQLDDDAAGADEEIVGLIGVSSIIFCVQRGRTDKHCNGRKQQREHAATKNV